MMMVGLLGLTERRFCSHAKMQQREVKVVIQCSADVKDKSLHSYFVAALLTMPC